MARTYREVALNKQDMNWETAERVESEVQFEYMMLANAAEMAMDEDKHPYELKYFYSRRKYAIAEAKEYASQFTMIGRQRPQNDL